MSNQLDHLKASLADRYTIERELGQGGMATVYLARDLRHDRYVALKVLRSDIAEVLGSDRFEQEIKLAAGMSHPNIMPVHDSGNADGHLYYVMPNVEGTSLRDRLNNLGRIQVREALRIIRAVSEALDYAHRRGVVHRDIKPGNIMFQEGHALVADFGIGKAMSSVGNNGLTLTGVALGTPAYMSPEQAAGEEDLDGRSDIYSLGCVLFEMLTGVLPFQGPTAQAVISMRFVQSPPDLTELCEGIEPRAAQLVSRMMARDPADRYASGAELALAIDTVMDTDPHQTTLVVRPSGTIGFRRFDQLQAYDPNSAELLQTEDRRVTALRDTVSRTLPWGTVYDSTRQKTPLSETLRVGTLFGLAFVGLLTIAHLLVGWLGLPSWVFPGVIAWFLLGLPILLFTGRQELKRSARRAGGKNPTPAKGVKRFLTWRYSMFGGAAALGALIFLTASVMALRLGGIGPFGTLVTTGDIEGGGRIVVADFVDHTGDPGLAAAVTEALRVDLAQSPVVLVVSRSGMRRALERIGLASSTTVDQNVALEMALHDGFQAIVAGEVMPIGNGYVLSARVLGSANGQELLAIRESARDDGEIIESVERLSRRLRERIGESLKNLRESPALSTVTTASLPALRRFSRGVQLYGEGRLNEANELLTDALRFDSAFAEAYLRLGELHEALGNSEEAAAYYDQFLELRRDTDPVVAPSVDDIRDRIIELRR